MRFDKSLIGDSLGPTTWDRPNPKMSLLTDSPVHSSSSDGDDFAAFLDAELDSISSGSSPDDEEAAEDQQDIANDKDGDFYELDSKRVKRAKLEETSESIEVPEGLTSLEQNFEASSSEEICSHPGSFGDMCILCGQRVEQESGVTFGYIHKGLRLGNEEIIRLRTTDMKNLLRNKKLYLVLDLDHTLLNSTLVTDMNPEEEYLRSQTDSLQDVSKGSLFMLDYMRMMTKLRPFVRTFLKEANEMFEMYIYTMGDRAYAWEMAKLLDPKKEYFSGRVISRDDGTQRHQKGLDIVLGQESAVLILDDTENAWTKHKDNLILMERYHFFSSSCRQFGFNCKSLSELKNDESDSDGALANVLKVLRKTHHKFFNELADNFDDRDVRQVLSTVRSDVLKGSSIVFSRVFPTQFPADHHHLWKMAKQLGATCLTEVDDLVTHVIAKDAGTEKCRWALKHKKFLVNTRWIEAANYLWQKLPEENFPVNEAESK